MQTWRLMVDEGVDLGRRINLITVTLRKWRVQIAGSTPPGLPPVGTKSGQLVVG